MSPPLTPLVDRVASLFASEEEAARKLYAKAIAGGNVNDAELAKAMRSLGKSPADLAREQNEFGQRKQWAETIKALPVLQAKVDEHGAAQRKLIEDFQNAGRIMQQKLAEERRLESLANAELKTALDAKAQLIAGRSEHAPRIAELRETIGRAKDRLTDLRAAITTIESGLAFCREAMKRPNRPLDEKSIGVANQFFGASLMPGVQVCVPREQVERTFNSLTVSLAESQNEQEKLATTVKEAEKEIAKLEAAQLTP